MWFFDTQLIIDRLKESQFGFEIVEGAAEYAAVPSLSGFRPGSVYVIPLSEFNPSEKGQPPSPKTASVATFGVVVVVRNHRGSSELLKESQECIGKVRKALIGFAPKGCKPCKWELGSVQDADGSVLVWGDKFTTTHILGA